MEEQESPVAGKLDRKETGLLPFRTVLEFLKLEKYHNAIKADGYTAVVDIREADEEDVEGLGYRWTAQQ